jgi:hypothetical protein
MKVVLDRCAACGEGPVAMVARAGRTSRHRNMTLPLPADLELTECVSCGEGYVDQADALAMDRALESAYQHELQRRAVELLDHLAGIVPQRRLEILLGLSVGYLSKIRAKEFPSAQLVTELVLLAGDPKAGLKRLEAFWSTDPPRRSTPPSPMRTGSRRR